MVINLSFLTAGLAFRDIKGVVCKAYGRDTPPNQHGNWKSAVLLKRAQWDSILSRFRVILGLYRVIHYREYRENGKMETTVEGQSVNSPKPYTRTQP